MRIRSVLLDALRFRNPRLEPLRAVTDSDWESTLSDWRLVRLLFPLRAVCAKHLPGWLCDRIDSHQANNAIRFGRIKQSYSAAAQALDQAGVGHLVLKGFSLFPGYTEHPRLRPQSDIDLYCLPASIANAQKILIELGYRPDPLGEHLAKDHLPPLTPPSNWKWRGNYFDPEMPVGFELHFTFWDERYTRIHAERAEEFWSRRTLREIDGMQFSGLCPVDNLVYTALNLLRDLLRGSVAAEQLYGLARFLEYSAEDAIFWRDWQGLHPERLRPLQAIPFHLAQKFFACRLSGPAAALVEELPDEVQHWFREFPDSVFTPPRHRHKDAVWLHAALLENKWDKVNVVVRRINPLPPRMPTLQSALPEEAMTGDSRLVSFLWNCGRYAGWSVSRMAAHLGISVLSLARGARFWLSSKRLSQQFWTFFAASLCFDTGMTMFFFLYNLFLLDRGYKEEFLGAMSSVTSIGSLVCTIPAGLLLHRLGLRRTMLFCLLLAPIIYAMRAMFVPRSALLWLAFFGGLAGTIWAVAISPAIARLTDERNRSYGFSIVFSTGIGMGFFANLAASRMPGWFTKLSSGISALQAKQLVLLVSCAIVALGMIPLSRVRFAPLPPGERKLYPRGPFLWRFLLALALWSLVTGSLSPLANVYFSQHLRTSLEHMGVIFSFSELVQVACVLAAPFLFRKLGLVSGIVSAQLATAFLLVLLAATAAPFPAALIYVGYSGILWMSEPGLFTLLMDQVTPAEQAGASSLNFFVTSITQAGAVAATGSAFARFGYPVSLAAMAAVAVIAAASFWLLLGREFSTARERETALLKASS